MQQVLWKNFSASAFNLIVWILSCNQQVVQILPVPMISVSLFRAERRRKMSLFWAYVYIGGSQTLKLVYIYIPILVYKIGIYLYPNILNFKRIVSAALFLPRPLRDSAYVYYFLKGSNQLFYFSLVLIVVKWTWHKIYHLSHF